MVIYARGGSEGTAVEAASRTGRRESGERSSWLSPSTSASSLHTKSLYKYSVSVCVMCVQLCIHVRVMKGTDTRLVNNRKYNMYVSGVFPCFWCSILQLIHMHNAHYILITFLLIQTHFLFMHTSCTQWSIPPLLNLSSTFATSTGRKYSAHKLQRMSLTCTYCYFLSCHLHFNMHSKHKDLSLDTVLAQGNLKEDNSSMYCKAVIK